MSFLLLFTLLLLLTCLLPLSHSAFPPPKTPFPFFKDISLSLPFLKKALPKYGGPCIADLDRDGIYDLILSNHNQAAVETYWGTKWPKGGFGYIKGVKLLPYDKFDVHGISAADINGDGGLEVLIERGGGNGFNPNPPFMVGFNGGKNLWKGPVLGKALGKGRGLIRNLEAVVGLNKRGARGRAGKFMDIDGDGDLDLVLINAKIKIGPGPQHTVYENVKGKFVFKGSAGDLGNTDAQQGIVADFNGDGVLDLILGHKLKFLQGIKGSFKFVDVTAKVLKTGPINLVMSLAEIDIDNDGDFDLYLARGWNANDVILENRGGVFYDISTKAGVPKEKIGHRNSVTVGDFNNDGYMDIFVARSTQYPIKERKPTPRLADYLMLNTGKKKFSVFTKHGAVTPAWDGFGDGCQAFDYDNDGRLDILSGSERGWWRLFKNQSARSPKAKYLKVRVLRSPGGKAMSLGAVVTVYYGKHLFRRRVGSAGASFQQSTLDIVHFGVGALKILTKVEVKWTNGQTVSKANVKPNSLVTFGV